MTIELQALQRIAVYEEPNGSYATDNSGTPSAFEDVPFIEGTASWTSGRLFHELNTAQQNIDSYAGVVQGWKRPTLQFEMLLGPTGTPAGNGVASLGAADSALFTILKAVFGGIRSGNEGSAIVTVNSQSSIDVSVGEGANWEECAGIGLPDASGNLEIHEVHAVATDTITTRATAQNTISTDEAYNATTIYLDESDTSLQFIVEGAEQDDRWVLQGMQATSVSLTMPTDDFWKISFTFEGANYSALSPQAITLATYNNFNPVNKTGTMLSATAEDAAGSSTTTVCSQDRSINLNIQFEKIACPGATYGIDRWKRVRAVPVAEFSFTAYYEDTTWFTAADNGTAKYLSQQLGTDTTDGGLALVIPNAEITDVNRDGDTMATQTVTARAKQDLNGGSTALLLSPFRFHFI